MNRIFTYTLLTVTLMLLLFPQASKALDVYKGNNKPTTTSTRSYTVLSNIKVNDKTSYSESLTEMEKKATSLGADALIMFKCDGPHTFKNKLKGIIPVRLPPNSRGGTSNAVCEGTAVKWK
jgi:uncharacterized protein YbjQ (UPF0145 family)